MSSTQGGDSVAGKNDANLRRQRILVLATAFAPSIGGYEEFSLFFAEALAESFDVVVATKTASVGSDPAWPFSVLRNPDGHAVRAAAGKADLVVMVSLSLKYLARILPFRRKIVVVHASSYEDRSSLKIRITECAKRWLTMAIPLNICPSQHIARRIHGTKVVIPNPYDETKFSPSAQSSRNRSVLFVGRLVAEKGVSTLIEAFRTVHEKHPNWTMTIAGDGPLRSTLQAKASALGLGESVKFIGALDRASVARQMQMHAILAVPSIQEAFGIVALEGLASGCRVVYSDTGGLVEASGGFGRSARAGDNESLAGALLEAVSDISNGWSSNSPALARHLAEHSRRRVFRRLMEAIEPMLSEPRRSSMR